MIIGPNGGFSINEALEKYKSVTPTASSIGYEAANNAINQSLNNLTNINVASGFTSKINEILDKLPVTNKLGGLNSGWDIATVVQGLYGVISGNVTPVAPNVGIMNNAISKALNAVSDALLGGDYDAARNALNSSRVTRLLKGPYKDLPFVSREKTLKPNEMGLYDESKWFISMEVPVINGKKYVPDPPYNAQSNQSGGGVSALKQLLGKSSNNKSNSKVKSIPNYSGTNVNFGNGFIPAVSYNYEILSTETEQLSTVGSLGINIPSAYNEKHEFRVEIVNDDYNTVFNYIEAYRDCVYPSYRTVLPYKLATTIIRLYVVDRQKRLLDLYTLLGILSPDAIGTQGSAKPGWSRSTMELTYDIVGELGENEKFTI